MRQAGRSLPEYRALRERHSFFELADTPELCAEVTLQPVRRHGVDAAVLFADIMTPVLGDGDRRRARRGRRAGGRASRCASAADVERLRVPDPEEAFAPVLEAVRIVRARARARSARSSASAAARSRSPATSSRGSRAATSSATKELMYREPAVWHALMERLADGVRRLRRGARPRRARTRSSSSTPGSACSRSPTTRSSSRRTRRGCSRPSTCRRSTSAPARRTCSPSMAAAGGDAIGLDWRIPLDQGWLAVGPGARRPGQPRPRRPARPVGAGRGRRARRARARRRPARPRLQPRPRRPARRPNPDDLGRLVELVHERTAKAAA